MERVKYLVYTVGILILLYAVFWMNVWAEAVVRPWLAGFYGG